MADNNAPQDNQIKAVRSYGHGDCVELATDGDMIAVRDSKNPGDPYFRFTRSEMAAFIDGARRGEFYTAEPTHG